MCEVLDEVEARGEARGEAILGELISVLLEEGKTEEAKKAASDEKTRKRLYKKYGIVTSGKK